MDEGECLAVTHRVVGKVVSCSVLPGYGSVCIMEGETYWTCRATDEQATAAFRVLGKTVQVMIVQRGICKRLVWMVDADERPIQSTAGQRDSYSFERWDGVLRGLAHKGECDG